jgi:hypothetical protein
MKNLLTAVVLFALGLATAVRADEAAHVVMAPSELQWGDAPRTLPPGAKVAVLAGDPTKPGLFILRLRLPANYKIPAHWHPTD